MQSTHLQFIAVCFAVKDEARPFLRSVRRQSDRWIRVLITGMGQENARRKTNELLQDYQPDLIISSGFAGALNPAHSAGTILFSCDDQPNLVERLLQAGAKPARFYSASKIVTTQLEKHELFEETGADAVDMESEAICQLSRAHSIPCAVIRVISDSASDDLPLDFNSMLAPDCTIDWTKFAQHLARNPAVIPELIRFHRKIRAASEILASTLELALD